MIHKTTAVRYYSKGGHTKAVAEAIAEALGIEAKPITEPLGEPVDILFLGASVHWGRVSKEVKAYIKGLDRNMMRTIAVFSTTGLAGRAYPRLSLLIAKAGIGLEGVDFSCPRQVLWMHKGRPDEGDLIEAAEYATEMTTELA